MTKVMPFVAQSKFFHSLAAAKLFSAGYVSALC